MSQDDSLVCAFIRSEGRWRQVEWDAIRSWSPDQGMLWVHLDWQGQSAQHYVREDSGIDPIAADALLAEESRPRAVTIEGNLLISLRGVNLNPGADPEDMVGIRLWFEPQRIISSRHRRILAINDIREEIAAGGGPGDKGEFLASLATRLVARMNAVIDELDEQEDHLENRLLEEDDPAEVRAELTNLRRQTIALRRYLAPQREALARLQTEDLEWLTDRHRARLREANNQIVRYLEDLDAVRERAAIMQDEMISRSSDKMNKNMYVLTLVATIMLPLGFLTGLLGINVDGMPGSQDAPFAFLLVCLILGLIALGGLLILKRLRWF